MTHDVPSRNPVDRIVVLRGSIHGDSATEYAKILQSRTDDVCVEYAHTPREEERLLSDASVATGTTITEATLEHAHDLRLFACATAGIDHLPLTELRSQGVAVTTGSGIHQPNVAEHVLDVLLTLVRRTTTAWRQQQQHQWQAYRPWGTLAGSTATIVGLGPIGKSIVKRLTALDVRTIGVRYSPEKGGPADDVIGFDEPAFHDALSRSDAVILACPLREETDGLIGRAEIRTLPSSAIVVNVARGEILETDALTAALRRRALRGAALDVTDPEPLSADHPLWDFENVIITPHIAGFDPEYWDQRAEILQENIRRIRETGRYSDLENSALGASR
ncbi:D-2-hydroxyacid dehydrogenase [Natrinema ejinorense]|uniref:Hydroxyacid dehydrogenase n=1 Tax=Natrinema ejinorense TaxID=373386 RepID=A0A2A5QQ79_9EURY|nr:D-2-hydroxyacid dehydrogenase [Natrinema ejinorense]PCR89016.1 hydroxyacid dehydrogenase [Natrinema ejinorense]